MTETDDHHSIAAWYDTWGACVAAVDFERARPLFAADVIGFGTHMALVHGLDALAGQQWGTVWPTIADFRFATEHLACLVSPDRLLATGIVPWTSTGFDANGNAFDRPGRATVVLTRADLGAPWLGRHTHFSLAPGTPGRSFGRPRG